MWDDSNIRSIYANVADVGGTREKIMLLFGETQAGNVGQKEVRVLLKDRVGLSPYAAKRLSIQLHKGIREYESKFGPLEVESPPSSVQ